MVTGDLKIVGLELSGHASPAAPQGGPNTCCRLKQAPAHILLLSPTFTKVGIASLMIL